MSGKAEDDGVAPPKARTRAELASSSGGWLRLLPIAIFLTIAGFFAYALSSGDPAKVPSALINKPVPVSAFPSIDGLVANGAAIPGFKSADLADGKVRVVNFWSSWCGPCVEEVPLLGALAKTAGVEIYGVNYKDTAVNARRFLARYGNPYAVIGSDDNGRSAIDWGVYGMPETYIISGRGEIVHKHVGAITADAVTLQLLPLIAKAKAQGQTEGKPEAKSGVKSEAN